VQDVEREVESVKPVHACPALDVPQVYVYGNDGPQGRGTVSLCNIDADPVADGYADYDASTRRWVVRQDRQTNQLQHMVDSPHLCPATPCPFIPRRARTANGRSNAFSGSPKASCR
jgi:hypothetical protein